MDFVHPIAAVIPGAQGRVLSVLAETTAELNLRTIARLSGVSLAQASRILPGLVHLGMVERREVPPSSQFRLARDHIATRAILALGSSCETVMDELGALGGALPAPPDSIIVFGSFARGAAHDESDIDVVFVRPSDTDEDDPIWAESVETWRADVALLTGNSVQILEVGRDEVGARLAGRANVWRSIRLEGLVVHGLSLGDLAGSARA